LKSDNLNKSLKKTPIIGSFSQDLPDIGIFGRSPLILDLYEKGTTTIRDADYGVLNIPDYFV
jgi:hypothetical protein